MLDHTCYFIACYSPAQAALLTSLLNEAMCLDFIHSRLFSDAKRPITKRLLQHIDLKALLHKVERQSLLFQAEVEFDSLTSVEGKPRAAWPSSLEELLVECLPMTGAKL
jgi:hypothetical protein